MADAGTTQPLPATPPVQATQSFAADIVSQPPSTFDERVLEQALKPDPPSAPAQWLTRALALVAVFAIGVVVGVVANRQFGAPATQQGPSGIFQRNFPGGGFGGGFPGVGQGGGIPGAGQNGGQTGNRGSFGGP